MQTELFNWGRLKWYARKNINNINITLGLCYINPGMENTLHFHPNCDEILFVIQGNIIHRLDGEELEMGPGDSLLIPQGAVHNAYNCGNTEAFFSIAFTAGERQTTPVI